MKMLHLSPDLSLPLDAVTQKLAWLGRTGSGKTYGASKLAEEMIAADAQVVVLDAVGVWYGLRLAADGRGKGIEIPVFGGLHGDVPLEPTGGALMANLVVDRGISVVIDVSQFETDAAKARFAHEWGDRFFFRKKAAPAAVHVFIEECQEFVPQNPQKGEERMLHAFQRIEKLGRNFGIGVSLISQRPQEVNKKALNQTECLFVFQMTGTQERKAIESWIADKDLDEDVGDMLPHLEIGQAHIWSPQWLKVSKSVRIAKKRTFNASSTPTVGGRAAAHQLAPIDLDQIRKDMAATIEKAKAEDPRHLHKTIADLRVQVARLGKAKPAPAAAAPKAPRVVERPVLRDAHVKRLEAAIDRTERTVVAHGEAFEKHRKELEARLVEYRHQVLDIKAALAAARTGGAHAVTPNPGAGRPAGTVPIGSGHDADRRPAPVVSRSVERRLAVQRPPRPEGEALPAAQQRIVDSLAWLHGVGITRPDKTQVSLFADLTPGAGHTINSFGSLRTAGLIEYPTPGTVSLTLAGGTRADHTTVPQSAREMQDQVLAKLPSAQARILKVLIAAYPGAMPKDAASTEAGLTPGAGHTINSFGRLRSLGLIDYPTFGQVVATPVLFLEGA